MNLDGTNLGRLVVKQGKMYNFNLSTQEEAEAEEEKCDKKEKMLVDVEIDGKNGPIPKLVKEKEQKKKVWMENDDESKIDDFETTNEKADAISELAEKLKGSISSSETNNA
mgnify:FL=1